MGACTMRYFLNLHILVMALGVAAAVAQGPTYHLGKTPSTEEIRAWDISIGPAGKELPPGTGTAKEGSQVYAEKCAACHGPTGAEMQAEPRPGLYPNPLVGGKGTLNSIHPVTTIGSFWPFATTVWDTISRSMPPDKPGSLSADEVYAVTAFLLYRNGIIQESDVLDAESLPKLQMPNRNGFVPSRFEDISDYRKRGCRVGHCP